jgi:hypothetical protein
MAVSLTAQEMQPPPDFSRAELRNSSEAVVKAWKLWQERMQVTERDTLALPMTEARLQVQRTYALMNAFFDARRAYSEKVAVQLEPAQSSRNKPPVNADSVNADEVELLGVGITSFQASLAVLRSSPAWVRIRHSIQADRDTVTKLQQSRRDDIAITRPFAGASSGQPITARMYRDSEQQVTDALQHLWTTYYQALADSSSHSPSESIPLSASTPSDVNSNSDASSRRTEKSQLLGAWTYSEGSQRFNGVGEPHQVVLELWMDGGQLAGRYRAELPDFDGSKRIDLKLSGKVSMGHEQVLEFHSVDPIIDGKILLQKQGTSGLELMLVRLPEVPGVVPKGRELLTRR